MHEPSPPESNSTERLKHQRRFVLAMVAVLLVAFFRVISSLLVGVVLGIILWAVTQGIFDWISKRVRDRRNLAAALSMIVVVLLLVIPAGVLISFMVADAASLAAKVQEWYEPYRPKLQSRLDNLLAGESIYVFDYEISAQAITERLEKASGQIGKVLITIVERTVGGLAHGVLMLLVTLYSLFFFYLDGKRFLEWLQRLLPLPPEHSARLFNDFFATSRATLKSVFVIGLVQGSMGGLAFWICGIPSPLFWTVLMAVASVIPAVGCQIITFPAALLLMLFGKFWYGLGLFLWSWIAIANADNLLRPYLVKREVNLHELLVFLTTIGGIATFGFFGVLIGPVIAALLKASLQMYSDLYMTE